MPKLYGCPRIVEALLLLCLTGPLAGAIEERVPPDYLTVLRLIRAKQYDAAISKSRQLIAAVPSFDGAYKKLAEASVEKGDPASAINYFNALLAANPRDAYAHYGLGLTYLRTKDFKQAQHHLEKSLEFSPNFAAPISWLIDVYDESNRLDEAYALVQTLLAANGENAAAHYGLGYIYLLKLDRGRALASLDRALELNPAILHAYKLEAELYYGAGEFEKCLRVSKRLLEVAQTAGDVWYEGDALNAIGAASSRMSDYSKAVECYERALRIQEDLGNGTGTGSSLNGLGTIYDHLGAYSKAITCYRRALALWQQRGDRRGEGTALHNIGVAYSIQGKYQEALSYYRQALKVRGEFKQDRGNTLNSIGVVYAMRRDYDEALQYYEQALQIRKETGDRLGEDTTLNNLADLYEKQGDYQRAIDSGQQALEIAQTINHREGIWRSNSRIARALDEQGKLEEALSRYESSIKAIENIRGQLRMGEQERMGFLDTKIRVYERTVHLLWKLHEKNPAAEYDKRAFAFAERAKARAFLDTLAESRAQLRKGMSSHQLEQENTIFREITNIQGELFRSKLPERRKAQLYSTLQAAEDRLEKFTTQLRSTNPEYAELQYPEPYDLPRAQKEAIDRGTLLVEFMLGEQKSFVWLVSSQALDMAALPARKAMEEKVRAYRKLVGAPPTRMESFDAFHKQAHDLFRCLLRPIQRKLDPSKRIVIVPDGILHYLPFETLVIGSASEGGPRYLIDEYDVAYAPSASVLASLKRTRRQEGAQLELLAYGDPLLAQKPQSAGENVLRGGGSSEGLEMTFNRLPNTKIEVMAIASLYPTSQRRLYLQASATETAVKRENLARYRRIHFATHGIIDENVPSRSGLLFSPSKGEDDGILQINEILNLEMDAELVVLSACQSGLGKLMRGEGMVGLTRAFMYAGAQSVVVSLWSVNDQSTAQFMKNFYEYMKSGKSESKALRQAKRAMLRSYTPAYRFPYFWAPFVLVGHPN